MARESPSFRVFLVGTVAATTLITVVGLVAQRACFLRDIEESAPQGVLPPAFAPALDEARTRRLFCRDDPNAVAERRHAAERMLVTRGDCAKVEATFMWDHATWLITCSSGALFCAEFFGAGNSSFMVQVRTAAQAQTGEMDDIDAVVACQRKRADIRVSPQSGECSPGLSERQRARLARAAR